MAENGASANGHRPARRRKHIYPPLEQMAAEQAASAQRRLAGDAVTRSAVKEAAPEATPPPAPPVMTPRVDAATNGRRPAGKRKRIYPPAEQMVAEQGAARARRAGSSVAVTPTAESAITADLDEGAVEGERVELRLSAVGMVDAGDVQFAQGAMGAARADRVTVEQGAVGAALADKVEVSRGYARSILARQVQVDSSAVRMVVAADVKAERTAVMFLVARRVAGDVRVLFDWRGAAAFGAVAGIVVGLLRRRPKG